MAQEMSLAGNILLRICMEICAMWAAPPITVHDDDRMLLAHLACQNT